MENLFLEADARKVFDGHSCPLGSSITGWQHLAIGSQSRPGAPLALFPRLSLSQLPLGQPLPSLTSAAAAGAHPCPKATLNQGRTWVFQVWVLCAHGCPPESPPRKPCHGHHTVLHFYKRPAFPISMSNLPSVFSSAMSMRNVIQSPGFPVRLLHCSFL